MMTLVIPHGISCKYCYIKSCHMLNKAPTKLNGNAKTKSNHIMEYISY